MLLKVSFFLFLLVLLFVAIVVFPACANYHHKDCNKHQYEHVSELVSRYDSKIVSLPLSDFLINLLLQTLTLFPSFNTPNIFLIISNVVNQHLIKVACLQIPNNNL